MSTGAKVLVIEDEAPIRRFLRASLSAEGYRVHEAQTAREGLIHAASQQPDLIVLDLGLPDGDGLEVLREVRTWSSVPVIVLSARGQEQDKVHALDAGADDYLTKPFGVPELLARLRVALRHSTQLRDTTEPVFAVGQLRVDLARRQVQQGEEDVHLTPTEYRLLTTLIQHAGRVLTHQQLLREVWGPDSLYESHYLRVYVGQLRQKLEPDPSRPRYILTEPGVGYRLAEV